METKIISGIKAETRQKINDEKSGSPRTRDGVNLTACHKNVILC